MAALGVLAGPQAFAGTTGPDTAYIVLAPQGGSTAKAKARIQSAGGRVVADYPQIGVVIASSTNTAFADQVKGAGVEAAASTTGLGSTLDDDATEGFISADAVADTTATGNSEGEPYWFYQWDMMQIDLPKAHQVTTGSPNVVVGVLDSGIAGNHPDLKNQIARDKSVSCIGGIVDTSEQAWQPTTSDHGTHVAGTIAAELNGSGVAGVAPGAKVAAVKVVNDDGYIFPEAAVCGFLWAADHGMQITNNSYYIDPWEFNCRNDARQRPVWQAVQRAIRYSQQKGVLNIASAGNSNVDLAHKFIDSGSPNNSDTPETREINSACVDLPAQAPGVVTVSATGSKQLKSYYSSYGQGEVDVAAPGGDSRYQPFGPYNGGVLSTVINVRTGELGYGWKQGTSMASPHASGVAALALSAHPGMTPGQLASFLERTAVALPCPPGVYDPSGDGKTYLATCSGGNGKNGFYGKGEVNAYNAVK